MCNRIFLLGLVAAAVAAAPPAPKEWPGWRGAGRDGRAEFAVPAEWPRQPQRRWSVEVGRGHASPVVQAGKVYVHSRRGEDEVVACLRLSDGRQLWQTRRPQQHKPNPDAREHGKAPNATPALHDGRLYVLSINGTLACWDAANGKLLWQHAGKEFTRRDPMYGAAASPLLSGGLCVAHLGGPGKGSLIGFDAASGKVRWRWDGDGPGYASAVRADLGGVPQVVTLTQRYCVGVALADGRLLWKVPFTTEYDQNSVTPLIDGDTVFVSGLDRGVIAYRVGRDGHSWSVKKRWQADEVASYLSSPVLCGGRLVGHSHHRKGQLFALDAATGRLLWSGPARAGEHAALVNAGPVVLAVSERGTLVALDPAADRYRELYRVRLSESATWAHPAVAGADLLLKDETRLSCWRLGR
jgi:outer membrane protein assembly factor BamB